MGTVPKSGALMPRVARIVVPGVAHHVIQRGNRQQRLFFDDVDRRRYVGLMAAARDAHQVRFLAWCLMDNHVHLVLVPPTADALRAALASAHTAYSQHVNRKQGATGHLFEGRYKSYPMDDAHLMVAVRYVENNPVTANMVKQAGDWQWSSARAHLGTGHDRLTDVAALEGHVSNWRAMLVGGLEAGGQDDALEASMRTGRPLASGDWLSERNMAPFVPGKRGPKPRQTLT